MQAWQSSANSGIQGLSLTILPIPEPGPEELLVQVQAAALNFSDLLMVAGKYQIRPPLPFTPGQEIAGTVVKAGLNTGFEPGQRIASKVRWGGFAEYAIVRADMAITIPDTMSFAEGAALPVVYSTAMVALTESTQVKTGETVLVHAAAGGVGLASVQIAKALGAFVIGTAGSDEKCNLIRKNGADLALNYRNDDWIQSVGEANDGRGADVILDSVGGNITTGSLRCIAWEGRLLIVGFTSGSIPAIPAHRLLLKRAQAIGVYWSHDRDQEMLVRVIAGLIDFYNRSQSVRTDPQRPIFA